MYDKAPPSFIIREALPADVPALAALHVKTFHETHGKYPGSPTYEIREHQWLQAFESSDDWFCFVIENENHELIGFAKGVPYNHNDLPDFSGELNKIYVLRAYQRQGLGRQLIGHVAPRFLSWGISSMLLFGDAKNPSNGFYEALGAEKLFLKTGEFHGGYGWRNLTALVNI
ncbi:MAG TPA: GNAT family N-acetyltransferase [Chitinophagaceae bacterium]